MEFKDDQMNAVIDRGVKLNAITYQLEQIKKSTESDEVRALAAAFAKLVEVVRPVVLFRP